MTSQASYTITAVKDGNDLDSILMLWKKTTTNVAPAKPDGTNLNGWATEMPEFESGAYVWTCNRVAISDPTASAPIYTYTDPVLDTHWKKLDEVYKQGTEIKNTVDNISLKYYNSNGEETSFKLTNGAIDITLLKNQVDAAATTATNFISMRSDGGIEVGNKSGGNWTGYRSQMLASEFNILNAAGKKVASYGASEIGFFDSNAAQIASFKPDKIRLGMSGTTDTAIDFNNGMLTLSYDADRDRTMMRANRMYIYSDTGYEISIGSSQKDANNDVIGGQVFCNDNGTYLRGYSGDTYSVDLYSEMYLRFDGRGLWESVGTDNEGYIQRSYIEMWPYKLLIRGQSQPVMWVDGRDGALLRSTNSPAIEGYHPLVSAKSTYGSWDIGTFGDDLYFSFVDDTYYNNGTNTKMSNHMTRFGELYLGGRGLGIARVLWSGTAGMGTSQTVYLDEAVSSQLNGIILVFSEYDPVNNTAWDAILCPFYIPKYLVAQHHGAGFNFPMKSFWYECYKYCYVADTYISGNVNNWDSEGSKRGALRYVLGV